MYYDFGRSGGLDIAIKLSFKRAPIVHADVYYNIDFFSYFPFLNILILS